MKEKREFEILDECTICKKGKLELVTENFPYTIDHLQCSNCDSTFNLSE